MVPSENRPKNRFTLLNDIGSLRDMTFNIIGKINSEHEYIRKVLFDDIINIVAKTRTFNTLNVFNGYELNLRRNMECDSIYSLNHMKSAIESYALAVHENNSTNIMNIIDRIDKCINSIYSIIKSDFTRFQKGQSEEKKEFRELSHTDFYSEQNFDNTMISKKTLEDHSDPFNIRELTFIQK